MIAPIIYWGLILVNVAWILISLYFGIFYFVRREYGNLWVFAFLNVLSLITLAVLLVVYHTWGWGITQYSNFIYMLMGIVAVLTLLQAILGKESEKKPLAN